MPALKYRTKLPRPDDPDIYEPICAALLKGHSQASAAAMAGIDDETLYHWRYKGQAQLQAAQGQWIPWEELGSHARFVIRIKEAQAGLVDEALDHIRGGKNDWAAWMTLIERRFPNDWSRNERREVHSVTVHVTIPAATEAELLAMVQQRITQGQHLLPPGPVSESNHTGSEAT